MTTQSSSTVDVSVIICCYGQEDVIESVVNAVTQQEFSGNLEVLVVDDCSPDNSLQILRGMLDSNPDSFRLISNTENEGAATSRNLGAELAQGEVLLFLDGDLIVDPGYVQANFDAFVKNPDKRICTVANIRYAEEFCEESAFVRFRNEGYLGQRYPDGVNFELKFSHFGSGIMGIRREDFEKVGQFDEEFRGYGFEDLEFSFRFMDDGGELRYVKGATVVHQEFISIERHKRKSIEAYSSGLSQLLKRHPQLRRTRDASFRLFTPIRVREDRASDLLKKFSLKCLVIPVIAQWWEKQLIRNEGGEWNPWQRLQMRYVVLSWYLKGASEAAQSEDEDSVSSISSLSKLATSLFRAFASHGLVIALSFSLNIVGTRLLGQDMFGTMAYAQVWLNFTVLVASLGLHTAAMAITASAVKENRFEKLRQFFRWKDRVTLWSGLVGALLMISILYYAFPPTEGSFLWIFVAGACVVPLVRANNNEAVIMGFKRLILARVTVPITQKSIQLIVVAICALTLTSGVGILHFYAGLLVGAIISAFLSGYFRRRLRQEDEAKAIGETVAEVAPIPNSEWWKFCLPQLVTGTSVWAAERLDLIILGIYRPMEDVAVYEIAYRIVSLLIVIPLVISFVTGPIFAENSSIERRGKLQFAMNRATLAGVLGIGLGGGVLLLFGDAILGVFGQEYLAANPILKVLLIGVMVKSLFGPALVMMNMSGRGRQAVKVMIFGIALNAILCLYAVPRWGAMGAAWSTAVAGVLTTAWLAIEVYRNLSIVPLSLNRKDQDG